MFPSLADTTDMRPELGASFDAQKWNDSEIYNTKKKQEKETEGNVCFQSAECITSYDKLTTNCSPVEKLFCMIGKRLHSNPLRPKKQSRLGAGDFPLMDAIGILVEQSDPAVFL